MKQYFFHRSMIGTQEGWPNAGPSKHTGSLATGLLIRREQILQLRMQQGLALIL